ncbi:MAG TPA: YXWGXW repeat-containing protein [Usitatibacter sp.]|nr:YXWGXW repeat-containing protein [Usitatibacter sp.]
MRKLIVGSLVAGVLGAVALPAAARSNVEFYVNVAPPAPVYEVVPAPRVGMVWVPGYWDWRHNRHHWVRGYWIRERPGYYYAPARWVERGGRYYYDRPHWRGWRDSDGDGVPNRYDAAPYNPRWR